MSDCFFLLLLRFATDIIEPRCKKTCLLAFRPGPTQTGLYSNIHVRWLECWNFGLRKECECSIYVAKVAMLNVI